MPSGKHYLIAVEAIWTWFLHCLTSLHPKMCFFANCSSFNACIMVLPSLPFSSLCHVGDDLQYTRYDFHMRLGQVRGASHVILCLECSFKNLKRWKQTKRSDAPWSSETPTFKLIAEARILAIKHSIFSVMAILIAEIQSIVVKRVFH